MGRAGRRVFKDKQVVFALDSVVHCFLFLFFFGDQLLYIFFNFYLLSALSPYSAGGEKVTIDEEKTAVCFGVFLIIEFTFMSKTLYMTVCSKNVLFSVCQSNEQLSKPLLNGIFSRTEPPTAIIDIKRSRRQKEGGSGTMRR